MDTGLGLIGAFVATFLLPRGFEVVRLAQSDRPLPILNIPVLPMPVETTSPQQPTDREKAAPSPRRIPHFEAQSLRVLSAAKAADALLSFINAEHGPGLFAAFEIDEMWDACCALEDLEWMDSRIIREELESRGLRIGKCRLNTPRYLHIKQRTGKDRLVLYRVPQRRIVAEPKTGTERGMAGNGLGPSGPGPEVSGTLPDARSARAHAGTGHVPSSDKKANNLMEAA